MFIAPPSLMKPKLLLGAKCDLSATSHFSPKGPFRFLFVLGAINIRPLRGDFSFEVRPLNREQHTTEHVLALMDATKSPSYNRALSSNNPRPSGGSHQKCQHQQPVFALQRALTR